MPDRAKSTPQRPPTDPSVWRELSPFRETFLQYVTDPLTREALLHLGEEAFQMVLEWRRFWPTREGSSIHHDLEAGRDDLRYLEVYLREQVAGHLGKSSLSDEELRLAQAARRFAEEVGAVVQGMGEVLANHEQTSDANE